MLEYSKTCVCCGEKYFDRGKDSLCLRCDGDGWRQDKHGFTGKVVDNLMYEFEPTKTYFKNKIGVLKND